MVAPWIIEDIFLKLFSIVFINARSNEIIVVKTPLDSKKKKKENINWSSGI